MATVEIGDAIAVVGAGIISVAAVIGAILQLRSWIQAPFEKIETAIATAHKAHLTEIANLTARMQALSNDLSAVQVHFDPNGGDLRGRLVAMEKKLAALEINGSAERSELRGLVLDLRPIIEELKERS